MTIETINYSTDRLSKNVREQFLNLEPEQVREALDAGRSDLVNVCMNLTNDFNKSSVIRSSNAFLAKETILVGKRSYDRRGTLGMHHFEILKHAETLEEVVDYLHEQDYRIYAVDNIMEFNPQPLYDVDFPMKSAFVYGEEQNGLTREQIDLCDAMVYIPTRGAARSINVAQAAAVLMSEYTRQHRFDK